MDRVLTGPRVPSISGVTKQLVILLHGYGANGDDLIDISHNWAKLLPDASFVSPNAPEHCLGTPFGRQWFALRLFNSAELWEGTNKAAPVLDQFIDAEMKAHQLLPSQVALVGFSQGTMMALHVGLRRKEALAGIVGYSGRLCLNPENPLEGLQNDLRSRPPVFLAHGDADMVVSVESLSVAENALNSVAIDCDSYVAEGLGHGIDQEGIRRGGTFLRKHFGYITN